MTALVTDLHNLPEAVPSVVTVGSYDGLHSGHGVLLSRVRDIAAAEGLRSVVVTFEPHPRIALGRAEGLRILTTVEEKRLLLEHEGIDLLVVIPFDEAFSRTSAEVFGSKYLAGMLGARVVVMGYNHHFGHDKGGDSQSLDAAGIRTVCVGRQTVETHSVSSTIIRHCIACGDMRAAVRLLGHPYVITGVADGAGHLIVGAMKALPPQGVYCGRIDGRDTSITIDAAGIAIEAPAGSEITIEIIGR